MSWITQTIDFYRGMRPFKAQIATPQASSERGGSRPVDYKLHELWLKEFEESSLANDSELLTPKQHGDRLLRLTKARALRRLLDRNSKQHDSAA